jgi:ubiquitin C-terminal hydrolase
MYDLVGLVSHSGGMSFGHYIAIVKGMEQKKAPKEPKDLEEEKQQATVEEVKEKTNTGTDIEPKKGKEIAPARWFNISDSNVKECTVESALNQQAFLLFYQLREK